MSRGSDANFSTLRRGLAELPQSAHHAPGDPVNPESILIVPSHRSALDPDRSLVVGNRGMGKSFWAHALADRIARERAARDYPELNALDVNIGFNASERAADIAPTPAAIGEALVATERDSDSIWRAVLVRVAFAHGVRDPGASLERGFADTAAWAKSNGESVDRLLTTLDDTVARSRKKLVIVFDALDRVAGNWRDTGELTAALLRRAVAVRSYRTIRLKLFMRRDQFDDPRLFEFPDGSKVRNTRVDLKWCPSDLYSLLFARLSQSIHAGRAFNRLLSDLGLKRKQAASTVGESDQKAIVTALAGEFMGADKKRGRVYTWLPLHLSDAHGETSPRTFMTAWRQAAHHSPAPAGRPVDHLGLTEGVRKASEDRLQELREDYSWISNALDPLRNLMVPMERALLENLWRTKGTVATIKRQVTQGRLGPVQLERSDREPEALLVEALASIGVVEIRSNNKINVPDIFRVEAGIKRKGGVRPPKRAKAT